ncbi:hypothetical protein Y032_0113g400 [Ancylostoma ceylanicum]|uniref:Uncharacterized protein n=1 Tax=Ancylostoma ceylanicum TaxID=53326 RepID=A0A016TDL2_9BILA|nr:hypothetical protein Y032_0113g400 [Ancylostoma ceylanicum]
MVNRGINTLPWVISIMHKDLLVKVCARAAYLVRTKSGADKSDENKNSDISVICVDAQTIRAPRFVRRQRVP